jgi:FdhD protein
LTSDAAPDPRAFRFAAEQAVEIEVNGGLLATLMCTPRDLDVLALGHLLTRGAISSPGDVASLRVDGDAGRVTIRCTPAKPAVRPLRRGETFAIASIHRWALEMFDRAVLRRETGGMHSAGIADRDGLRWIYEDVGRHNAVDKAIGRGLVERVNFSRCCLISSGRLAAEMVVKVVAAGIPVFASRSIPTTAAYEIAVERGLTMIGRIASESPIVYTMRERVA